MSAAGTLTAVLAMTAALLVPPVPVPVTGPRPEPPELTAGAWILYDAAGDVVLAEHQSDEPRAMASVTKVMTALVVRAHADLEDRVRISELATAVGESEVGLVPGERWTVRDLLYALLVRSANDAAVALAEHVGGSVEGFAELMNERAAELGLTNSSFTNPHGLDENSHYSSASDLAVMATALLHDDVLATMVRTRLVVFKPAPDGSARIARNTNRLLGEYPGTAGVKTGFTGVAGKVLISALETPDRLIIGVVMGSDDHFADSRELLEYGEELVTFADRWQRPLLLEQGGAGLGDPTLDEATRARLLAVPPLPDAQGDVGRLRDTAAGTEMEERLRELLPQLLGGSG